MTSLLKKGELKSSSLLDRKGQKAAHQGKSITDKKKDRLLSTPGVVAEERDDDDDSEDE
jgi:hypothetical protein